MNVTDERPTPSRSSSTSTGRARRELLSDESAGSGARQARRDPSCSDDGGDKLEREQASLRGMVEEVVKAHPQSFPPPALTDASSSSSTSFGSVVSSAVTSRTTSPAISSLRFPPTSPSAMMLTSMPIDADAAAHKLSKLSLPAPSLPLHALGGKSGGSTPMPVPEPARPEEIGAAPRSTSRQSAGSSEASAGPSPLSTPPILPRHSGYGGALGHSPALSSPDSFSTTSTVSTAYRSSTSEYDGEGEPRPPNFGVIAPGAYRSGFPKPEHFPFLRTLGLKTILLLVIEPYPDVNRRFAVENDIEVIQLGMPNNKDPLAQIPAETIRKALAVLLDVRKHPLLVHCNRGKHRTGCVVGCLRRMQQRPIEECVAEYVKYSTPKERISDQSFIRSFACDEMWAELVPAYVPPWLRIDNFAPSRTAGPLSPLPRRISNDLVDDPCEARGSTPKAFDDIAPFGMPRLR